MPKLVEGRNGGKMMRREKGDPPLPGAGRPVGSRSFKTLLTEALERTTKDKDGKEIQLKEATALQLVGIMLSKETDDNTKLRAFQIIRDTLGEVPPTKTELTGADGDPLNAGNITLVFNTANIEPVTSEAAMQEIFDKYKDV